MEKEPCVDCDGTQEAPAIRGWDCQPTPEPEAQAKAQKPVKDKAMKPGDDK